MRIVARPARAEHKRPPALYRSHRELEVRDWIAPCGLLYCRCGGNIVTVVVRTTDASNDRAPLAVGVYRVPSGSMGPTLSVGARVVVEGGQPQVGDIVVFHPPKDAEQQVCGPTPHMVAPGAAVCSTAEPEPSSVKFIKRVVAVPGDVIYIKEGHVYRNGTRESDPDIAPCGGSAECNFPTPIKIRSGYWFLMGDNRGESDDSRFWGPVPTSWIVGVVR